MELLTQGKSLRNVPRPQQRPAGATPEAITALVQKTQDQFAVEPSRDVHDRPVFRRTLTGVSGLSERVKPEFLRS